METFQQFVKATEQTYLQYQADLKIAFDDYKARKAKYDAQCETIRTVAAREVTKRKTKAAKDRINRKAEDALNALDYPPEGLPPKPDVTPLSCILEMIDNALFFGSSRHRSMMARYDVKTSRVISRHRKAYKDAWVLLFDFPGAAPLIDFAKDTDPTQGLHRLRGWIAKLCEGTAASGPANQHLWQNARTIANHSDLKAPTIRSAIRRGKQIAKMADPNSKHPRYYLPDIEKVFPSASEGIVRKFNKTNS